MTDPQIPEHGPLSEPAVEPDAEPVAEELQTPEEICRKMADVREVLDDDIHNIAQSAKVMSDWTYYVKQYPWASVGVAATLGYLLVPNKVFITSPSADQLEKLAKRNKLVVKANPQPQAQAGIVGALFSLVASMAMRGAMAYVGQQLGKVAGVKAAEPDGAYRPVESQHRPAPPQGPGYTQPQPPAQKG
jgi:hypothetical protein